MSALYEAAILGTGSYVPEKVLTNEDLSAFVDTSDEWIVSRTGIRERRIAADDQATSDLAFEAAPKAIEAAGITPQDIDLIIFATTSPDHPGFPSTGCVLQHRLGLAPVPAVDVMAACSGFMYGLTIARQFVRAGQSKYVLVVGAEVMSRILDWSDRRTCVLFGDAAGAAVVGRATDDSGELIYTQVHADGAGGAVLQIPAGGTRKPLDEETVKSPERYVQMNGREVFKFSVSTFEKSVLAAVTAVGVALDDIDMIVPHQVNDRILQTISKRLGYPLDKMYRNLDRYGNTSAASVPLALDEAVRDGAIKKGDLVLMIGFGGGFTWGTAITRW